MFFYPRFVDVFEDPFTRRRRRRNIFDVDLFEDDPFTSFFDSSDEDDEYYQVPMLTMMRRKNPPKKNKKVAAVREKQRDPMSLFFRDFGEGYPKWVNEFFGEEEEKEEEEKKKEENKIFLLQPLCYFLKYRTLYKIQKSILNLRKLYSKTMKEKRIERAHLEL